MASTRTNQVRELQQKINELIANTLQRDAEIKELKKKLAKTRKELRATR